MHSIGNFIVGGTQYLKEPALSFCVPAADRIEGFEDYGKLGRTSTVANHTLVFMVRWMLSMRSRM